MRISTFTITLAYRVKIKHFQTGNTLLSDLTNGVTSICKNTLRLRSCNGLSKGNYYMISINNSGGVYLTLPNDSITHHTKALGNQTVNFPIDDCICCTTVHSQEII